MLSPDELERAGDLVAAAYSDIEAQMLDHLVAALLAGDALTSRDITALALLAQTHDRELRAILEANAGVVEDAVRETVETYLEASDADDMARAGGGPRWPQQVEATVAGIALVLARDNLKMVEGAKSAFLAASAEAVTKVNSGMVTTERALHQAVRKLEREGIPIITYQNRKTGTVTVENRVDVAVRRHIRTQIAQDGARMTMERMEALGVDLVEVSSHCDSRPEHRTWQGRCYSLRGDVEVEGTRYPDFYSSTGYGSVDGLMGANCRHSFGPYRHGAPRAYEPDPKHPSGLPGEEVYRLEQRQRAQERRIRAAKREVRGAQRADDTMGTVESRAALAGARQRLTSAQAGMRSLIDGANEKSKTGARVLTRRPAREWAGDMPTAKGAKGSGRKLDEFLGGAAAARVKASGMSRTAARSAMRRELADIGLTVRQFPSLTASQQQDILKAALTRRKPTDAERRRASMKPVDEQLYASQRNYVERHGGIVLRGGAEVEKHLDDMSADASQIGGVIMLREPPTTSEVLEEVFHFDQERRGDYADEGEKTELLREIDAQKYLLSVARRYNIPESESAQTRDALAYYERKLIESEGGGR